MPNRAIEFHDSTFSAAYIHESNGEPGQDAGSGWVQEIRLHISEASLSGEIPETPCDLWDGEIRLGNELLQMVPIPLDYKGAVEISLEQDGKITIAGTQVRQELIEDPTYIEEFPGHR
jgi:hypothetical protein